MRVSSATAEPHFPASCCIATRCAEGRTVSQRSFPLIVAPLSWASVLSTTLFRFVFEPVRKSFSDSSSPARERDCVE